MTVVAIIRRIILMLGCYEYYSYYCDGDHDDDDYYCYHYAFAAPVGWKALAASFVLSSA